MTASSSCGWRYADCDVRSVLARCSCRPRCLRLIYSKRFSLFLYPGSGGRASARALQVQGLRRGGGCRRLISVFAGIFAAAASAPRRRLPGSAYLGRVRFAAVCSHVSWTHGKGECKRTTYGVGYHKGPSRCFVDCAELTRRRRHVSATSSDQGRSMPRSPGNHRSTAERRSAQRGCSHALPKRGPRSKSLRVPPAPDPQCPPPPSPVLRGCKRIAIIISLECYVTRGVPAPWRPPRLRNHLARLPATSCRMCCARGVDGAVYRVRAIGFAVLLCVLYVWEALVCVMLYIYTGTFCSGVRAGV